MRSWRMDQLVPWAMLTLCAYIALFYPKARLGDGRPLVSLEWILCIHFSAAVICVERFGSGAGRDDDIAVSICKRNT